MMAGRSGPTADLAPTAKPMGTEPRTVAIVFVVFALLLGLPALLYALAGRTDVALGLLGLFLGMVAVSAYALREAAKAKRASKER